MSNSEKNGKGKVGYSSFPFPHKISVISSKGYQAIIRSARIGETEWYYQIEPCIYVCGKLWKERSDIMSCHVNNEEEAIVKACMTLKSWLLYIASPYDVEWFINAVNAKISELTETSLFKT